MSALANGFCDGCGRWRRQLMVARIAAVTDGALHGRLVTQSSYGIQQLDGGAQRRDAEVLQVLRRQAGQNRLVYLILAEAASYFPRPRLRSQTTMSMTGAHNQWLRTSWFGWAACPGGRGERQGCHTRSVRLRNCAGAGTLAMIGTKAERTLRLNSLSPAQPTRPSAVRSAASRQAARPLRCRCALSRRPDATGRDIGSRPLRTIFVRGEAGWSPSP